MITLAFRDFLDGCGPFSRYGSAYGTTIVDLEDKNAQHLARRYLPPIKVSAVRDFLPFCSNDNDVCQEGNYSLNNKNVVLQNLAVDDNLLKNVAAADGYGHKRKLVDFYQTDSERKNAAEGVKKLHAFEPPSQMKMPPENKREKYVTLFDHHLVEINSKAVVKEENLVARPLDVSRSIYKLKGDFNSLQVSSDRNVVTGLMAKSAWPWRSDSDKGSSEFNLGDAKSEDKRKKVVSFALPERSRRAIKTKGHFWQKPLKKKGNAASSEGMGELEIWEKDDCLDNNEISKDLQIFLKSHEIDVNVTPSSRSNLTGDKNDSNVARKKVRETLRLFQVVSRKLLQEAESKLNEPGSRKRVDLTAARFLKKNGNDVNSGKQILGHVPGVEVGDEFQYRVELNIIGLHRQIQGGIDYVKHNGKILATSIVASGGYADYLVNSDVLIYTGQGGNVMNTSKKPLDQKLERGNLALKNSSEEKNPVRVIRGSETMDEKYKTYVYDGLYVVESYWQDRGSHGKLVYKFRLQRISCQNLALKEVKKSN